MGNAIININNHLPYHFKREFKDVYGKTYSFPDDSKLRESEFYILRKLNNNKYTFFSAFKSQSIKAGNMIQKCLECNELYESEYKNGVISISRLLDKIVIVITLPSEEAQAIIKQLK